MPRDVRQMLRDVDAGNIEHSIRTLAAFGTRHTLSSQTDPNRGIGAADRFLRGSDNGPFLDQRYPAVRLTEPNEDYRHEHQNVPVENGLQFGDLVQFVDFRYAANVTRLNLASLAALADGPAAPQGVEVEAGTLTVDTTLEWQSNTELDLAGYEIVYRDTNVPYWQYTISVGNVTSFVVKGITKDNFIFGVRAVDRDGNRSVVTFPVRDLARHARRPAGRWAPRPFARIPGWRA